MHHNAAGQKVSYYIDHEILTTMTTYKDYKCSTVFMHKHVLFIVGR